MTMTERDCPAVVAKVITVQTTLIGNTTMTSHGTAIGFECISGFNLQGESVLRCQDGTWDQPIPACIVTPRPRGWRTSLSNADVIVLAACCALLLFLLLLAVIVCALYRRRMAPTGDSDVKLEHPVSGRHRRRRSSSSFTSLTSDTETPAWNTHMPWHGLRRQAPEQMHRTWTGITPSYYPSYMTSDMMPSHPGGYPMASQPGGFPLSYFHWSPATGPRRQPRYYHNMVDVFSPFDANVRTTLPSVHKSRLGRPATVFDPYNPIRWDPDRMGYDYNRTGLPRAHLRPTPSDVSADKGTKQDRDVERHMMGRAAIDKRSAATGASDSR